MYVLYYASMLRCWHLLWILVRTGHPCLGVGCHNYVDFYYLVQNFQAAYAQLIPGLNDKSQWSKSSHGFFMYPPLMKSIARRRQNQRFRSGTEGKSTTKKGKGQHQCPICNGAGHHWHNCKEGDLDDIAAMMAVR
jgi:hypothetical protein